MKTLTGITVQHRFRHIRSNNPSTFTGVEIPMSLSLAREPTHGGFAFTYPSPCFVFYRIESHYKEISTTCKQESAKTND